LRIFYVPEREKLPMLTGSRNIPASSHENAPAVAGIFHIQKINAPPPNGSGAFTFAIHVFLIIGKESSCLKILFPFSGGRIFYCFPGLSGSSPPVRI
jgi:hypothetical protein